MKSKTSLVLLCVLSVMLAGCYATNPTLRAKARNAVNEGNIDRGLKLYNKALSQNEADWQAIEKIADIRMDQEKWIDAQLGYEKVISLQPENVNVSLWLDKVAECLFKQGRANALQDMLRNANEQYGTSTDFLRQANYLGKLGDMDQAKLAYQKAIHFAAVDNAEPYIAMAAFYELLGDKGNAIELLRQAHAIAPENLSVADRLRHYGIVPGPAAAVAPVKQVPPMPQIEEASEQGQADENPE